MDIKQMKEMILSGENISVEFKESKNELNLSSLETVVAFLNKKGGYCIFGVSDNKEIVGVNEDASDKIKVDFANLVNNPQKINPPMPLMLQEMYIDDKLILYVYVPESSEVHKLNNSIIYERTDEGDRDITNNQYALKRLYLRKSGRSSEDFIYKQITIDDFDNDTINKARKLSVIKNSDSEWKDLTNEEILKQPKFYKKDFETGEYGFNLASILLFGKKETISSIMSWYKVDIIKRIKDTERYDDRFICEDNLINSFDEIQKYINSNIESPFFLDENGVTYNATGVIVREIVGNILIHRDFMDATSPKIIIYKDKIVATNPNMSRNYQVLNADNFEPFSKNAIIAKVFRKIGYADELGSGVRKINDVCNKYFKSKPIFEDKDVFKVEVDFISESQQESNNLNQEKMIIEFIKENGKINNEQCRNLLNVEKSRAAKLLLNLFEKNIVMRHGKGRKTYYDFIKE